MCVELFPVEHLFCIPFIGLVIVIFLYWRCGRISYFVKVHTIWNDYYDRKTYPFDETYPNHLTWKDFFVDHQFASDRYQMDIMNKGGLDLIRYDNGSNILEQMLCETDSDDSPDNFWLVSLKGGYHYHNIYKLGGIDFPDEISEAIITEYNDVGIILK